MRVRLVTGVFAVGAALCAWLGVHAVTLAFTTGASCSELLQTNDQGLQMRILFAKNGAVQRYVVVTSHENPEGINDMHISLEKVYGPEGINAPPLHIVSFKAGSGGMMVPDKAVDSCGRTQSFQ